MLPIFMRKIIQFRIMYTNCCLWFNWYDYYLAFRRYSGTHSLFDAGYHSGGRIFYTHDFIFSLIIDLYFLNYETIIGTRHVSINFTIQYFFFRNFSILRYSKMVCGFHIIKYQQSPINKVAFLRFQKMFQYGFTLNMYNGRQWRTQEFSKGRYVHF